MAKVLTTLTILVILMIWTTSARNDYRDYNKAAFEAQNKARTNPKYYADRAKDQLENKFVYDRSQKPTSSICLEENFVPKSNKCYNLLSTNEGPSAWKEAINELSTKTYNLKELKWSEGLAQACFDHIKDIGPKGITGHTGSDGSSPFVRIDRYTKNMGSGENLSFSDVDGSEDAVLQLLIDDGVSDRGHRKNILNNKFTHGGVSCGCHTEYVEMCCFAYGIDIKEKDPSLVADSAPQLKECREYNSRTEGTTNQNYHLDKTPSKPAKADTTTPSKPEKADNNSPKKQTDKQVKPKENNSRKQDTNKNRRDFDDDLFPGLFDKDFNTQGYNPHGFHSFPQGGYGFQFGPEDWDEENW